MVGICIPRSQVSDPVNPTSGDTDVANIAINSFDGIVFGIFDDNPFSGSGSYTVSGLMITEGTSGVLLGDVNQDGVVDFFDIAPFIELLANNGVPFLAEADIDLCGKVDFFDIQPFINILAGL